MKTDDQKVKILLKLLISGGSNVTLSDLQDCSTLKPTQESEFSSSKKMFVKNNEDQLIDDFFDALDNKYKGLL